MKKWNMKEIDNFVPSKLTLKLGREVNKKLKKVKRKINKFKDIETLFAVVELQQSHNIENIFLPLIEIQTLSKRYNTKKRDFINEDHNAYDISFSLLHKNKLTYKKLIDIEKKINKDKKRSLRYKKGFGIYNRTGMIYEPTRNKKVIDSQLKKILLDKNNNIINVAFKHIWFERVHPFIDGNGRLGRLLILNQLGITLPFSARFFGHRQEYYSSFKGAIDFGVQQLLVLIKHSLDDIIKFVKRIKKYKDKDLTNMLFNYNDEKFLDIINETLLST